MEKPKFHVGDIVCLDFAKITKLDTVQYKIGKVWVVDPLGTYEQNEEPSYDIFVKEENMLYKHCRSQFVHDVSEKKSI